MKAPDDEHINKIINPVYCRGCGKSIHADAISCPHCGAQQQPTTRAVAGSPALAIVSCVMGVLLVISILLADAAWDHDAFVGGTALSLLALVCGALSLHQQNPSKSTAVIGLVTAGISLLFCIGNL